MPESAELSLIVNGRQSTLRIDARTTLADVLRDRLGLTGTHLGCEQGICGSCTVLLDGRTARSCITLAMQADGAQVWTVEGLSPPVGLSRLQQALRDEYGLQCGFCTPGFVVTATELLAQRPDGLDEATVRDRLGGNLCRCTGYEGIVDAVLAASAGDVSSLPGVEAVSAELDAGELTAVPEHSAPLPGTRPGDRPRRRIPRSEVSAHAVVLVAGVCVGAAVVRALTRRRR